VLAEIKENEGDILESCYYNGGIYSLDDLKERVFDLEAISAVGGSMPARVCRTQALYTGTSILTLILHKMYGCSRRTDTACTAGGGRGHRWLQGR
jgi:hypothetical protein